MQTKPIKRDLNGLFLLDKPLGLSSNRVLQKVRWLFQAKKAGHTGSLDPLASGMLPICFGEATKFAQYGLMANKTYAVRAILGIRTTTSDAEGEVVSRAEVPQVDVAHVEQILETFLGTTQQIPSMYSALKYQGQPLYVLARQGITVDRPSRPITIYSLSGIALSENEVSFTVTCSKGTYIRTLVDDFGQILGCGAHVSFLRRLSVGGFEGLPMYTMDQLLEKSAGEGLPGIDRLLHPVTHLIKDFPQVVLTGDLLRRFRQGQPVTLQDSLPPEGLCTVLLETKALVGLGKHQGAGVFEPVRLVST